MNPSRPQDRGVWQIGDWTLDEGRHRLVRGDDERLLKPKEMGVLLHLADAAPNSVSAEDFFTRTWPDVIVGDHVLHEVVARLRKVFDDKARQPIYIETLPKRGYRLICSVARRNIERLEQRR